MIHKSGQHVNDTNAENAAPLRPCLFPENATVTVHPLIGKTREERLLGPSLTYIAALEYTLYWDEKRPVQAHGQAFNTSQKLPKREGLLLGLRGFQHR